jgi:hypothetical protein
MVPHITPCEATSTPQNGRDSNIDAQGVCNGGPYKECKIIGILLWLCDLRGKEATVTDF